MAKKNAPHVRIGKYEVSSHTQNRTVEKSRDLKKKDMVINLLGKSKNSPNYKHKVPRYKQSAKASLQKFQQGGMRSYVF